VAIFRSSSGPLSDRPEHRFRYFPGDPREFFDEYCLLGKGRTHNGEAAIDAAATFQAALYFSGNGKYFWLISL
jgi:hypothetical protein